MTYVIMRSDTPVRFAYFDGFVAILLLLLFLFRRYIRVKLKIAMVLVTAFALGFTSVYYGGFSGAGITLFMLANLVAVAFLNRIIAIILSVTTILSLLFVWLSVKLGWVVYYGYNRYLLNDSTEWLIHIGTLSLFLIVAHVSIRAIKNYLTSNIAELESSIDKVYKLAYFDQLTGIPNRFMFNESLLKRTEIHHVNGYLVLFDLKGFKLINSLHGNELGDEILIKIAQVFNELKGDREMVARISGNEYAWWMEGLVGKTLNYRLEYLKEQFYIRLRSLGIDKKIEFHVSYAHFPTNGGTIDKVYQKATMALEYAKTIKHVNVVSYNQTLEQITRDEEALKEMLLRDIENEAFHLAFQEKVYVKTGKVLGLEVLARWQTQTRGGQ